MKFRLGRQTTSHNHSTEKSLSHPILYRPQPLLAEVTNVSARRLPEVDENICVVVQWKDMVDARSPWWRKAYYRFVYAPFLEFSLRVVKIPNPTEVSIEGKRIRFSWLEWQGFFASADQAEIACVGERWGYKALPFGRSLPDVSGQYLDSEWVFPRAKNPRKRARPMLAMVFKDRKQEERDGERLRDYLRRLNQELDNV